MTLLVVDDESRIRDLIRKYAVFEGYEVEEAADGMAAVAMCRTHQYDLIIMDVMMPELDGFSACREIRKTSQVPVIMLSARGEEYDRIHGFELGVDDYVVKPFYMGELLARIRVAMRKSEKSASVEMTQTFQRDYLKIDFSKRLVYIDEKEVHLTPIEYKLLALLVTNRGKVLTHNQILSKIWGYGGGGDANSLRVFMATLRRKIEKDTTNPRFIITEVGVGYRFAEKD